MSNDHTKISQSIIANQVAMNFNHEIKSTGYHKGKLKAKLLPVQLELIKEEREEYEKFFEAQEVATAEVYKGLEGMVKEIALAGILNSENIMLLVRAFNKDPKSLQGLVNKILR